MTDPLHPKTAQEAAEAFMRGVPTDDPKMPEPVALMDAAQLRELTACNSMRVQCGNPPVYDEITAKAEGLVPVITTEASQAYAEALAAKRVARERERERAGWSVPTTYLQRFTGAVTLMCGGRVPPAHFVAGWLDGSSDELQAFAATHGPSWAQGCVLLDAAAILADTPTEGVDHGARPTTPETGK